MSGSVDNLFIASSAYLTSGVNRLAAEFPGVPFTKVTTEAFASSLALFVRQFRKYERVVFYTHDLEMSRTILWHGIVWWLGRQGLMLDGSGRKRRASLARLILRDCPQLLVEPVLLPYVFSGVLRDLTFLKSKRRIRHPERLSVAYLRTDHWFGTKAGGSVTHIAGVANSFRDLGIPLFFLSSDRLELIDETRTPLVWVKPGKYVQNVPDAPQIAYNLRVIVRGKIEFESRRPTIVYQRYSQYNYAGAYLAAQWNIPFVLEYNGSEVWMARHWGSGLQFQRWAEEIEMANLKAADAIVVVSDPMKGELTMRGVDAAKILVNPNGVDTERFNPARVCEESRSLRRKLGIADKVVAGFIGTFGRWHGAEVLAKAIRSVVARNPDVQFLFIGDGARMPAVRDIVEHEAVSSHVTFAGLVPQEDGPVWLGACDILVSPHVPNPDGSPFFGSPTKLFEYMAMSRGIVASRLDQIAEILRHKETAFLTTPGDVDELADGILTLANDRELARRLGANARAQAIENHTWTAHVRRIIDHLHKVLG